MKYKYYWKGENKKENSIELKGDYFHPQDAAVVAAEDDFYNHDGWERNGVFPILILVDQDGEEFKFEIEVRNEPVFSASST
ncbi:MAG: hypothetical protein QNJ32_28075 [Xenococcaceae cyanobacterium MO_167.B27]|nr:hypothetical protein [Xenococcaceae cyanobacterium MO_167.B27]